MTVVGFKSGAQLFWCENKKNNATEELYVCTVHKEERYGLHLKWYGYQGPSRSEREQTKKQSQLTN